MQHRAAFFYTDEVLVISTDPVCIQVLFDTLNGLFDRVGLRTNVGTMVGIICCPCRTVGTQLEALYERQMMGEGLTYRARQGAMVHFPDCGEYLAEGSLEVHRNTQHGLDAGGRQQWETPPRRRASDVSGAVPNRNKTTGFSSLGV